MAHDVFISYSKKDKAVADAICARLEQDGVRCWYAPRDIVPGADWAASIIEAIEKTKVMVLVFTDFANASRQVLREINNAVRCGVIIVPFRMTRAEPSKGMRYYLSTVHWLDAMDAPLENSIHQLSRKVTSVLCGTDLDSGDRIPTEPAAAASPAAGAKSLPTAAEPAAAASSGETPAGAPEKGESGNKDKIRKLLYALAALAIVGIGIVIGSRMGDRGQTEIPASAEPAAVTAVPAEAAEQQAPPAQAEAPAVSEAPAPAPAQQEKSAAQDAAETAAPTAQAEEVPADGDDGAPEDNYLYAVSEHAVKLQKYFGEERAIVRVPATVEGKPVTTIDEKCFEDRSEIEQVILPETLSTIEYRAFYGCSSLREINFPASMRKIGGWAFAHTALENVVFPDDLQQLGYGAFYSCAHLESVVLPEAVDKLGENTFRLCPRLKRVTIGAPEQEIHIQAFDHDSDVVLVAAKGSYAEKYAHAVGLSFEAIGTG